jgi:histidinol-phosphate aminotransferase
MADYRFPIPHNILQIRPYKPGKPEEELMRELNLKRVIKLASNENCLGPSPLAMKAMQSALARTHRYPDGSGYYLRHALSEKLRVDFSQIILGNGSTDLVNLIARTYLQAGDNSITADQTFLMYKIATLAMNGTCTQVPLQNYTFDLPGIAKAVNENTRLIYIANPNNPSGTIITADQLKWFLTSIPPQVLVVLDEAYFHYVDRPDYPDGIQYLHEFQNLIVLRTFSKVYGLAGIRMGFGIACAEIIENLNRIRSPFNTSVLAQAAALAALDDHQHVLRSQDTNRKELAFLQEEFTRIGVPYIPSVANFILLPLENASKIYELLLHKGIIVRPMNSFNLPEGLRITIGTHEENVAFLDAFQKIWTELST